MTVSDWLATRVPYGLYDGLRRALDGCDTVLDVGCGTDSMMMRLAGRHRIIGLDRYLPSLVINREKGVYAGWIQGDLKALPLADHSVDAVVLLDVIEHFEKAEGLTLLAQLARVARRRVVVLTPNGFVSQPASENPWQEHRSGWAMEDFQGLGYRVSGVYGWKRLRGPYARLRFRPFCFWEPLSALSHLVTGRKPRGAFHLLAVRRLDEPAERNIT